MMKIKPLLVLFLATLFFSCSNKGVYSGADSAKREFRGAWIQCVNGQFQNLGTERMKQNLTQQLNELQKDGVNAIIFQVRPECDALYKSPYEPWSRFLTGVQGQAPSPYWDPLEWMVEECHKRGMELHAWINPYRARMKSRIEPAPNHIVRTHPERVFEYDGLYVLNPGIPSNRDYICTIVKDIVKRYDIDGLHMDDYFYPYPVAGLSIPDSREFAAYNNGFKNIEDWRRDNVNLFIKQVNEAIKSVKPWVKFGVSPFGIYRNKKSDPLNGSDTNGTQNYDQLYADVLLWVNNGWIDYCVPQLYWEIGHKAADYKTLITWWNKYTANRHLYIGEDVERTVKYSDVDNAQSNQMPAKFKLHKQMKNVKGTVLWYSRLVVDDLGQYGSMLKNYYWKNPALPPLMPFIDKKAPKSPRHLEVVRMSDGNTVLCWDAPKGKKWGDVAEKFVVYKFGAGEKVNLFDPSKIVAITSNKMLKLPYVNGKNKYTYVVTALDRMSNESKGEKINVRL